MELVRDIFEYGGRPAVILAICVGGSKVIDAVTRSYCSIVWIRSITKDGARSQLEEPPPPPLVGNKP